MKLRNLFIAAPLTLSLFALVTFGMATAARAQAPATTPTTVTATSLPTKRVSPLIAGLTAAGLTEPEKAQVKTISKKYRAQRKALMPEVTAGTKPVLTPEQRAQVVQLEDNEAAEIKAILTPDQQTKFQSAYDAAKAHHGGGGPLAAIAQQLNLTEDQKTKIAPILESAAVSIKTVREDTTLDRRTKAQKAMALWNDAKSKIRPLLTPEQQATLDSMRQLRGGRRGGQAGAGGNGAQASPGGSPAPAVGGTGDDDETN